MRLQHRRDSELEARPSFLAAPSLRDDHLDDRGVAGDGAADQGAPARAVAQVLAREAEAVERGRRREQRWRRRPRRRRRGRRSRVARGRARAPPPPLPPPEEKQAPASSFSFLFFFVVVVLRAGIDKELRPLRKGHALEGHSLPRGAGRGGSPKGEAPGGRGGRSRVLSSSCPLSASAAAAAAPNAQRQRVEAFGAVWSARRGLWRGAGDLRGGQASGAEDGKAPGGGSWSERGVRVYGRRKKAKVSCRRCRRRCRK